MGAGSEDALFPLVRPLALALAAPLSLCVLPGMMAMAGEPASPDGPRISVDELDYSFGLVPPDRVVEHVFRVANEGKKPLVITRVATSCGCTAAMMESSVVDPGKVGKLRVSFNPRGQRHVVSRTVTIHSNDPERPALPIRISAEVGHEGDVVEESPKPKRAHGPEKKLVFEKSCMKCHGPKSEGQKGAKLFSSACEACHGKDGRGVVIERELIGPPLRLASTMVKTPGGITQVISSGTGDPRMPGFGREYGGPLTEAQVQSLVELIIKGFPSR